MLANTLTRPTNPGALVPNPSDTVSQIANAEYTHRTMKKLYLETLLLERIIIQKIIEAVDTKYLSALRTPLVLTILNFLYNNYGHITPQQLDNKITIRQINDLRSGPTNQPHIQLHQRPG